MLNILCWRCRCASPQDVWTIKVGRHVAGLLEKLTEIDPYLFSYYKYTIKCIYLCMWQLNIQPSLFIIFCKTMDDIVADIRAENITIISQQVFLNDPLTQIQNLKVSWVFTGRSIFMSSLNIVIRTRHDASYVQCPALICCRTIILVNWYKAVILESLHQECFVSMPVVNLLPDNYFDKRVWSCKFRHSWLGKR